MIDLYTWPTPNGHKIHIMLEETGLPYRVIPININHGDQFDPAFLKISPNNKIPAIIDPDGPDGAPQVQGISSRAGTPRKPSAPEFRGKRRLSD